MATAWSQMGREGIAIIQRGPRLIAGLERFEWGRDRRCYNGARARRRGASGDHGMPPIAGALEPPTYNV